MPQPPAYWELITHLGSVGLMLPVFAGSAIGLLQARQNESAKTWGSAIVIAVLVTLISKIAFLGWGVGIAKLDFTGISGHALLAAAVLPVAFGWLLSTNESRIHLIGAGIGFLLAIAVGVSRVELEYHSVSEVACAWIIGFPVSGLALMRLTRHQSPHWAFRLVLLLVCLAIEPLASNIIPTHDWEAEFAVRLSGHDRPFTREFLHSGIDAGR